MMEPTTAAASSSSVITSSSQAAADDKIAKDLQILTEKMKLLDALLKQHDAGETSSVESSELLSVIGFLEACAPRMIELVEAAAQGALSEQVLIQCLDANDRLTKSLCELDKVTLPAVPQDTPADVAANTPQNPGFDLFLRDDTNASESAPFSTGEDSKFPPTL